MGIKKIAVGGISTECSTYSPLYQNESDFVSLQGQTLIDLIGFPFDDYGIETYPIFFNRSVPGGPIESQYFRLTKDKFINGLESLGTLDGVLLFMHGAIFVDDIDDPEGEWIEAVREVVGKDCIISVSFFYINVRGSSIGCKGVNVVNNFVCHLAVQIKTYRDDTIFTDNFTNSLNPFSFWVIYIVNKDGTMHKK
jgi:hypothetical protein